MVYSELNFEFLSAVEDFDLQAMEKALCRGANINAVDENGYSALHTAAFSSRSGLVEKLILRGADVEIKDKEGKTPLFYAISNRDFGCVKHLIEDGGSDVNVQDSNGDTIMHNITNLDKDEFNYLIANKAKLDITNNAGRTSLHIAVDNGFIEDVMNLINAGADRAVKDHLGMTPLMIAIANKQEDIIDYLKALSEQDILNGIADKGECLKNCFQF